MKNHLLPAHYLGFDWSGCIVLIKNEILITTARIWPVNQSPLASSNGSILEVWIPCRGLRIPGTGFQSLSVELRFWLPIYSGIPDSTSIFFPDSGILDSL